MADIKPFICIRPEAKKAARIAALPYDVYNTQEARVEVEREPLSFLKIDRAETQFSVDMDCYDKQVYDKARETLWQMVSDGDFIQEQQECYYIYELTWRGRTQDGLVACASIDDYLKNVIKKHENTREEKEQDRIRHVDCCNAQTGPIFLAYRTHPAIREIIAETKQEKEALYDFTAPDGVRHRVFMISEKEKIERIHRYLSIYKCKV